ncbi:MAG: FAD binding domain-containing protein [Pirellulales bacterium]
MKAFEYAAPRRESELAGLFSDRPGATAVLAGGTDLVGLMKKMIVAPDRVVNIKEIASLYGISADSAGVTVGAVTRLDEMLDSADLDAFPAVKQAIRGINSMQLQSQGTIGGELCQRPRCWYFRNGCGLPTELGRMVERGDNRYHAIFGNRGPAKYVSASRIAPALVALGASVRIVGPASGEAVEGPPKNGAPVAQDGNALGEAIMPLADFFVTPRAPHQGETVLDPDQIVTHIHIPRDEQIASATYEVRQSEGPEYPLAAAAAALRIEAGVVTEARIVLGQVAPVPWVSEAAAAAVVGQAVTPESARAAGEAAVARATPLSQNRYKVQLARVSVERAILQAAGLETGGF